MLFGVFAQIEGILLIPKLYIGAMYRSFHYAKCITTLELQNIIIDQEDILNLHDVGVGSSEHGINKAGKDRNVIFTCKVFSVCVYRVILIDSTSCEDFAIQFLAILLQTQPDLISFKIDLLSSECESASKIPCLTS